MRWKAVAAGCAFLVLPGSALAEPSGPTPAMIARIAPPLPPRRPATPLPSPGQGAPAASEPAMPGAAEGNTCRERLTRLGIRFEMRPPLRNGACGTAEPVLVSGVGGGIEVSPPATTTCEVAEALTHWTMQVVKAEAERHFRSLPTKVHVSTSYECRNQRSGGKMSEHAFANGLDLMGFSFDKRPDLTIGTHAAGSPEAAFQDAVRAGACPYFTTVLGPGSDAAHGDHLHVDMRKRKAGYRICQ